jgi:hypothetical protein
LLSGKTFGDERLGRGPGSFFLDLSEQPGLDCRGRTLSLRMIMSETASLEDYRAQFGDAAATGVVEVDKREAGPGHRILEERDRRCSRQAMLAAEMQKGANKAVATISVLITAARPVIFVGKKLEHEIEQLDCFCDFRFGHWSDTSGSGNEFSVSASAAICIAARSRQNNRLDQQRITVLDVADAWAHRPA